MATCKECGVTFKPYWQFTDVEEETCEHCARLGDDKKGQRCITGVVTLVLGIVLIALDVLLVDSLLLQVAGIALLTFSVLKLITLAVPAPQES